MDKKTKRKARCRGQAPPLIGAPKRHIPLVDLLVFYKMITLCGDCDQAGRPNLSFGISIPDHAYLNYYYSTKVIFKMFLG